MRLSDSSLPITAFRTSDDVFWTHGHKKFPGNIGYDQKAFSDALEDMITSIEMPAQCNGYNRLSRLNISLYPSRIFMNFPN